MVSDGDVESLDIRVKEASWIRVEDMVIEFVSEVQHRVNYAVSLMALVG